MTQDDTTFSAERTGFDLGALLFERTDSGRPAAYLLVVFGLFAGIISFGFFSHPWENFNLLLGPLLAIICAACLGAALYFWRRNLRWLCYENGVVEATHWGSRKVLYTDVERLKYSATRDFQQTEKREHTTRVLVLSPEGGGRAVTISSHRLEKIGLVTDPIPVTAIEVIRDRVAALIAERMDAQLNSEGSVSWTQRARLLREGIETTGRRGVPVLIPWERVSRVTMDHEVFRLWGDDRSRPLARIPANETNSFPGLRVLLKQIVPRSSDVNRAVADEAPADSLICPVCGKWTDSLKCYEFRQMIFLGPHSASRTERVAGCPRCMRRYLAAWGLLSLVTANVVWPFLVMPMLASRFTASFCRGHSVKQASYGRSLARDFAIFGLIGTVCVAIIAGLFFAFGDVDNRHLMTIALAASLASFLTFTGIGAAADL